MGMLIRQKIPDLLPPVFAGVGNVNVTQSVDIGRSWRMGVRVAPVGGRDWKMYRNLRLMFFGVLVKRVALNVWNVTLGNLIRNSLDTWMGGTVVARRVVMQLSMVSAESNTEICLPSRAEFVISAAAMAVVVWAWIMIMQRVWYEDCCAIRVIAGWGISAMMLILCVVQRNISENMQPKAVKRVRDNRFHGAGDFR
jgi:hypothetical protein